MAKRLIFSLSFALLLSTGAAYAETYGAVLTGAQEVPAVNTPGFGFATVTMDAPRTSITVVMTVTGLTTPVNNAHIHGECERSVACGVKRDLLPSVNLINGQMSMTFDITKELGDAIAARPQLHYINVHTTQNGGGEIRGQLTPLDNAPRLAADLRGANERPNPVVSSATGSAIVTLDQNNNVSFDVTTAGLVPTRAHIHAGDANSAGGIRVSFAETASAFTAGRVSGTTQALVDDATGIRANPANFYVNVHSAAFPGGEIRGQLFAANEYDIAVAGKVVGVGGENFVTDVRVFNPSYSTRASALLEYFQAGGSPNATATKSMTLDIPPRGTAVFNDVAGTTGFDVPQTTGGVRVTSATQLAVSSRIYDDRRARNGGTIGQFVPGIPRSAHLRRGVLAQLQQNTETRTNIGFFNPNPTTVDIRVEMRDPAGVVIGTFTRTLEALTQQQSSIPSYFSGFDVSNRAAFSVSFDASAPILVYGSVIDNVSSDQIFVSAAADPGSPAP